MKNKYFLNGMLGITLFLGIIIIGCNNIHLDNPENNFVLSESNFVFDEKTFTSNWNAWNNKNILNYSFTLVEGNWWNNSRDVLPPYEIKYEIIVKDGILDSFEYFIDDNDLGFELEKPIPPYASISDMYQKIFDTAKLREQWHENNPNSYHKDEYILEYNMEINYIKLFRNNYYDTNPEICCPFHSRPFVEISEFKILE